MMRYRLLYLILAFLVCVALAVTVNVFFGIDIVYTHLFYIPIIFAGIWYPRYAVFLAVALGMVHVASDYAGSGTLKSGALFRAGLFIVVGCVTGYLTLRHERLRRLLQASEESFAAAFRLSPVPLMIRSIEEGRLLDVNERGLEMLGCPREEALAHPSVLDSWFADQEGRKTLEEKMSRQGFLRNELVCVYTKQGEVREVLWSAETIKHRDNDVTLSLFYDITERQQMEKERARLITELQTALSEVKVLSGLIPICSSCKKIRDDKGYWSRIESYIESHSMAEFSHGICPDCTHKLYPAFYEKHHKDRKTTPGSA
jgi:PAS domain S-box-containing protein